MTKVNIVLLEPEIPQNTGNIARTCAATGASLHLIRPLGFEIDDRKLKRAGLDYWNELDITYYDGLDDFFDKHKNICIYYFSTKAPRAYTEVSYGEETWLMFGKETKGLPDEFTDTLDDEHKVRIPMVPGSRCMNLSNSVAIFVFESWRQLKFSGARPQ